MMNCPHCNKPIYINIMKDIDASDLGTLLDKIGNTADLEKAEEREFIEKMRALHAKWGDRTRVTPRQIEWIRDIAGKSTGGDEKWPF